MSTMTDSLMKQLRFISEAANAFRNQTKQQHSGQQRVLAILGVEDGVIQSYLAEVLDLRPSSLAELLKKMENTGDITRVEDTNDKRIKRVQLTEQGRQKAELLNANKEKDASEAFFAGLTEEERQTFSTYLEKIADGWNPDFKEQAERFIDPLDRLQAMQHLRDSFMDKMGDWQNLPPEELRKMRREMRDTMKRAMRGGEFDRHRHTHRHSDRGGRAQFERGMNQDFERKFGQDFHKEMHRAFWKNGGFFGGFPKDAPRDDTKEKNSDSDTEWQDF